MPRAREKRPDLGPLGDVIDRCLKKRREERFGSAEELCAALEQLAAGAQASTLGEDGSPFAGLAAFQEADAGRFFGREREVPGLLERLRNQPVVAVASASAMTPRENDARISARSSSSHPWAGGAVQCVSAQPTGCRSLEDRLYDRLTTRREELSVAISSKDLVPLSLAETQLAELAEEVRAGTEKILTRNGEVYIALIDARRLDHYHRLEREHIHLMLLDEADRGLDDVEAGRTISAAELGAKYGR